jgi:uncharacterized protein YcaQ
VPPSPIEIDPVVARRFHRRAVLLDEPVADVGAVLDHLGYVQIDPINVCGRMQDLILRNRVNGYQEGGLVTHIHAPERPGLEHYLPGVRILCAFPAEAWPHLAPEMEARRTHHSGYSGRLSKAEEKLARHILGEIAERGPLMSDNITHSGRAMTAWGTNGREVKVTLEKLFFHGRVLITARRNFRRVYDLPERVLSADVLRQPRPSVEENRRWLLLLKLRQRRLAALSPRDAEFVADAVQPLQIGPKLRLHILCEDLELLKRVDSNAANSAGAPLLLAPLDPLIYDRRVTRALWDFDYTWEVYTPPEKRVRGYYALPVLAGDSIVGHVDLKANRAQRRLEVVSRKLRRGVSVAAPVKQLAKFIGVRR